jgi:phage gp36-like protein
MAYATQTELEDYLGGAEHLRRVSDKTNTVINAATVARALNDATAEIDKFANGTAGWPWSPVPAQAKAICLVLATCRLYEGVWGTLPPDRKAACEEAMQELEDLRAGKTSWVEGEPPASTNVGTVFYNSSYCPNVTQPGTRRARRFHTDYL